MAALAVVLVSCAGAPRVVVEKERPQCSIPAAAVATLPIPESLVLGATNEDLRNREQALEAALVKCNARLQGIPAAVNTAPAKPASPPGFWERLKNAVSP